jgi:hypothetical protein
MNTKIVSIVVVVLVVLGAAFFLMRNKGSDNNKVYYGNNTAATKTQATTEQQSFKTLLASGGSRKCTYSDTQSGVTSQGTVYVAGGKFRGDFSSTVNGKVMMSHMISDGQSSYLWTDGMASGYKMKFDASAQANANASAQTHAMDTNKNMNFHCDSWSGDSSMFNLPTGVQFTDMTNLMGGATGSSAAASGTMKIDVCASLKEPAKSQCMAAYPK